MKLKRILILSLSVLLILSTLSGCDKAADFVFDKVEEAFTEKATEATNSFFDDMLEKADEGITLSYLSTGEISDGATISMNTEKYNGTDPLMLKNDGGYLPGDIITHTFLVKNNGDSEENWSIVFTSEKPAPAMGLIDVSYTISDRSMLNSDSFNFDNIGAELGTLYSLVTGGDASLSGQLGGGESAMVMVHFTVSNNVTKELASTLKDFSVGVKLG